MCQLVNQGNLRGCSSLVYNRADKRRVRMIPLGRKDAFNIKLRMGESGSAKYSSVDNYFIRESLVCCNHEWSQGSFHSIAIL